MIFQGIRTSIAKKPYVFVIFKGGPDPMPPPPLDPHLLSLYVRVFVLGSCFVMWFLMSSLAQQSSSWGREAWLLYFNCAMTIFVQWPFLKVPWVGLQSMIVTFRGHTQLHYKNWTKQFNIYLFIFMSLLFFSPYSVAIRHLQYHDHSL